MSSYEARNLIAEAMLDAAGVGKERFCACNRCRACRIVAVAYDLATSTELRLRHEIARADAQALYST